MGKWERVNWKHTCSDENKYDGVAGEELKIKLQKI